MTQSGSGPISEWLNRPFYTSRGLGFGPKLTNFAVLVVVVLTAAMVGVVLYVA